MVSLLHTYVGLTIAQILVAACKGNSRAAGNAARICETIPDVL